MLIARAVPSVWLYVLTPGDRGRLSAEMTQDGAIWRPERTRKVRKPVVRVKEEIPDPSLEFSPEAKKVFEKWADELIKSGKEVIYPLGK